MPRARWPDVILLGYGASDALQMTVESQQVAVRAGRVLALGLPARLHVLLAAQGVEITDLSAELTEGGEYATAYATVAATVLARAASDPPAVFLSQGNPLFLNAVNRYVLVEAKKRELSVRAYPGVSPVDAIVSDLGIDVGAVGVQALSARGLLARPQSLNAATPLIVLQVAGVAEGSAIGGGSAEAYGPLVQALGRCYPEQQPITLLNMPGDGRITRATVTLARFAELIPHIDPSSSLFIDIAKRATPAPGTQGG